MIYYLVNERMAGTMRGFLETWGRGLVGRIAVVSYDMLLARRVELPEASGTYIFTSLGSIRQMTPDAQAAICGLHDRLVAARGAARVLNDPGRALLRYDLLRLLHERGINSFQVYRTGQSVEGLSFPAFIRDEWTMRFERPTVAQNAEQYGALLNGMTWLQGSRAGLITVEFCDTVSADGLYRKYGAFIVGDRVVPRHVLVSRNWFLREPDLNEPSHVAEELAYVEADPDPHEMLLLECARAAGISYGRIDYGLLEGRPQIWEINTNAGLVNAQWAIPEREPGVATFVKRYAEAMAALDPEC